MGLDLVSRFKRLHEVKKLVEEGLSSKEIAKELSITNTSVDRSKRYLKELSVADLTNEEIANKRSEFFIEYGQISDEAREMYNTAKIAEDPLSAKRFLELWKEVVEAKAKLYGLDTVKASTFLQVNQQFNVPQIEDTIDLGVGEEIADLIKSSHEKKLRDQYNE